VAITVVAPADSARHDEDQGEDEDGTDDEVHRSGQDGDLARDARDGPFGVVELDSVGAVADVRSVHLELQPDACASARRR
jgi:hypothetical protein